MSAQEDVRFLAKLVHRSHLSREEAEPLLPRLKEGAELDDLLEALPGWDAERVDKMRRTEAGERPEIPGHEILGTLGVGGTAEVFRARAKKTGQSLALKILSASYARNPVEVKAFIDEAKLLERLDHPGLVKGYGPARADGTYLSRMEVVEGKTLLEYLDEGHLFDEDAALRIVLEVAEVLSYMASEGLVHRDIKPGNIMLSDSGRVKLIDLGFCAAGGEMDQEGSARGTVQYLSPEQAEGGAVADLRSDIYALGVTLYQLTIGSLPFEGDCDQDVLRKHVMERLSSPELKGRGHSPHLHYFIEKMMSKDAELRYQSWDELLKDVREQVEGRASLDFKSAASRGRGRGRGIGRGSESRGGESRGGESRGTGRSTGRSSGRGRRD
ncbi:Serine/threonine-protein kinase PknB [Planctomycetes bacterium Poly30]|uniref:Serine/threonine-protein kinase PknB n=1 Tax=Saltatorellus ferox TaxID=2528018 RepID=A0A518EQT8_9BACT|nr:Serine/threonine-protein kinase PknB [Planctomycetes bacterium Poly30]